MTKEEEYLNYLEESSNDIHANSWADVIRTALTELQAIKEAKPSEALECSLKLYKMVESAGNGNGFSLNEAWNNHKTIKQALQKAQQFEKAYEDVKALPLESLIETYKKDVVLEVFTKEIGQLKKENQELKEVLGIIKKVFNSSSLYMYKLKDSLDCGWITQEEYNKIEEYFERLDK